MKFREIFVLPEQTFNKYMNEWNSRFFLEVNSNLERNNSYLWANLYLYSTYRQRLTHSVVKYFHSRVSLYAIPGW